MLRLRCFIFANVGSSGNGVEQAFRPAFDCIEAIGL
jgi:hypothetical protein